MKSTQRIFRTFYEGVPLKLWFLFQKVSTPCVSVNLKQIKRNFKEAKLFSRSSDILCLFGICENIDRDLECHKKYLNNTDLNRWHVSFPSNFAGQILVFLSPIVILHHHWSLFWHWSMSINGYFSVLWLQNNTMES